ncbi:MAG: hypothetical protein M1834_008865 [Cirrosporium novae-zelandiae]|nr:MAG: hypothetical protein M1834_008865 [Cirrosporium novae-zelandiae]
MFSNDMVYEPKDAVGQTINSTLITGGAGLLFAAVQNSLAKHNVSAWGVFTKSGGIIATFAGMGASFEFMKTASANLRQKDDPLNHAIGGLFAGSVLGLHFRTIPAVMGYGAGLAVVMGAVEYTGNTLGTNKTQDEDDYAKKMKMRMNRRRPIQETLDAIGEGRGIMGPGYAERRAKRIKENYGIDVPTR